MKSRVRNDDRGMAVVVAVAVMSIALGLGLLMVKVATSISRDSGVDRQRAVAVNAAEAGLDTSFIKFQSSGATLPCPGALDTLSVAANNDGAVTSTTVQYFDESNSPVTNCSTLQANALRQPMKALITSTAATRTLGQGTTRGNRAMQAYVRLRPDLDNGFSKALFGDAGVTVNNNHTIRGNVGDDAHVYTNGSFTCPSGSNQTYHGSIYAQGSIGFGGQCKVLGDLWGNGAVAVTHNQSTVGGRVISSTSSVALADVSRVGGVVVAGTTISPASCVPPKCQRNSPQGPPPAQPFPQIELARLAEWTTASAALPQPYVHQTYTGACSSFGDAIINTYAKTGALSTPVPRTVVTADCAASFTNNTKIKLYNDLVIFANKGFSATQKTEVESGDGQPHMIYWIVPYESKMSPCTADIVTGQNFSVAGNIDMMMYTPCDVDVSNSADHFGQIYAGGTLTLNNQFDMTFQPLPVFGINPASLPLMSYTVDIIYKREVRAS